MDKLRRLTFGARALHRRRQSTHESVCDVQPGPSTESISPIKRIQFKTQRVLIGHLHRVYGLDWGEDSQNLVSVCQGGRLICWDTYSGDKLHLISMSCNWVMTCACSPSFRQVASGGMDNVCTVYSLGEPMTDIARQRELTGHTDYLSSCKFVDDEKILTTSGDHLCILWDIETGNQLRIYQGHTSGITSVAPSPNKRIFITGSCDATAKLWDLRQKDAVHTFTGHKQDVNTVVFFPSGESFATGSDDSTCRLYDIREGNSIGTYSKETPGGGVDAVAFSKTGRILYAFFDDSYCWAWDTLKHESIGEWASRSERISSMAMTPDGKAIATGSYDSEVKIRT